MHSVSTRCSFMADEPIQCQPFLKIYDFVYCCIIVKKLHRSLYSTVHPSWPASGERRFCDKLITSTVTQTGLASRDAFLDFHLAHPSVSTSRAITSSTLGFCNLASWSEPRVTSSSVPAEHTISPLLSRCSPQHQRESAQGYPNHTHRLPAVEARLKREKHPRCPSTKHPKHR